jgi:hypothetical protein
MAGFSSSGGSGPTASAAAPGASSAFSQNSLQNFLQSPQGSSLMAAFQGNSGGGSSGSGGATIPGFNSSSTTLASILPMLGISA